MIGRPKSNNSSALDALWSMFFKTIGLLVFAIIAVITYTLLADELHAIWNAKPSDPATLKERSRTAEIAQLLEQETRDWDRIENGIHIRTGLHADPNLKIVVSACTSCHSAKLITQNRATRDGWESMIRWMQATQGLADLGVSEPRILDYLATYYAPIDTGRRKNLDVDAIEWYVLEIK